MTNKEMPINKRGAPPKYSTPEEMQPFIDEYFDECAAADRKTTLPGLIYHLGFADRQSIYDYEKRPAFSCIIKRARMKLEEGHVNYGRAMDIFVLKNHYGYVDKQEVSQTNIDLSDEELNRKIKELSDAITG